MPIPEFQNDGLLPAGIHNCTLQEVRDRFGAFARSDRRVRLFQELTELLREVRATGLIVSIIIDGSFVTAYK